MRLFPRLRASSSAPRHDRSRRSRRTRCPGLGLQGEPLEQRHALAVSWSGGTWNISGDADPARLDDTIVIDRNPANTRQLRALVNGVVVGSRLESTVKTICISGGNGNDSITVAIPGNTRITTVLDGGVGNDTILGSDGADRIMGGTGRDTLNGGKGNDALWGGGGRDSLIGSAGNDRLYGEAGVDTLRGGAGRNLLDGGIGVDNLFGNRAFDQVTLDAGEQLIGNESTNPLQSVADLARLKSWYIETAMARWGGRLGQEAWSWAGWPEIVDNFTLRQTVVSEQTTTLATNASGTNNQVAGVDEGDSVKTDGQHLFVLAGDGVDIVNALPADQITIASHITTPGTEWGLFLSGTRLTVVSSESLWQVRPLSYGWWGDSDCSTVVTVIDVSNAASPTILETTRLDGRIVNARAIEGRVLVVTEDSLAIPEPAVIAIPAAPLYATPTRVDSGNGAIKLQVFWPGSDGTRYVYEDEAAYRARLEEAWYTTALPHFTVIATDGSTTSGDLVTAGHAYLPLDLEADSLLSVTSFEVSDDDIGPDATTSVAGVSGTVYSSASSLYVAGVYRGNWWDVTNRGMTTNIYKFDLQNADVPLVAMGAVPGMTLNQFSFDESEDGLLRVATTNGFGSGASSGVFVLAASAGNLQSIGSVVGLAPGERIHSVRFVGERGYVCTFRQIDPLFVIDLANPTSPRVAGELKIPGFSSYLHPLDATHLLGVGRDADPVTGRTLGLQLSIFDVSNPAAPTRTATYTFAGDGWESWSEALWDHHALSWFADRGILALPVDQGGRPGGDNGLVIFKVDTTSGDGFTKLGEITHDGHARRSLRIGGYLYSVSAGQVKVHRLDDPTVQVGGVTLTPNRFFYDGGDPIIVMGF